MHLGLEVRKNLAYQEREGRKNRAYQEKAQGTEKQRRIRNLVGKKWHVKCERA